MELVSHEDRRRERSIAWECTKGSLALRPDVRIIIFSFYFLLVIIFLSEWYSDHGTQSTLEHVEPTPDNDAHSRTNLMRILDLVWCFVKEGIFTLVCTDSEFEILERRNTNHRRSAGCLHLLHLRLLLPRAKLSLSALAQNPFGLGKHQSSTASHWRTRSILHRRLSMNGSEK